MGETATFESRGNIAIEDQSKDDLFGMEATENDEAALEQWGDDDELTVLVRTNAEEIVRCPWMDNAEVTLSAAMNAYDWPPDLSPADEPFLIAIVNELLANRPIKPEETKKEEGEREAEEEFAEPEDIKTPKDDEIPRTKEPESKTETKVLRVEIHSSKTTNEEPRQQQPTAAVRKPETPSIKEQKPLQPEIIARPVALPPIVGIQAVQISKNTPEVLEGEIAISRKKVTTGQQAETLKIAVLEPKTTSIIEEHPVVVAPRIAASQRPEFPAQPLSTEAPAEPEYSAPLTLEIESPAVLDVGTMVPTDEMDGMIEDEPPSLIALHYEINTGGLEDSSDEVVRDNNFEIPSPEIIDDHGVEEVITIQTGDTLSFSEEIEADDHQQPVEVGITAVQAESLLVQLGEHIKDSDPRTTEMARDYLDKITEVSMKLEAPTIENAVTQTETETTEELEKLFTELFDLMDIPHTPELVEYLVHQIFARHAVDEIEKLKDEEVTDETAQDDGMYALIKKLIASLKTLKRSIAHYCAVGRTALKLCSFNAPLALGRN